MKNTRRRPSFLSNSGARRAALLFTLMILLGGCGDDRRQAAPVPAPPVPEGVSTGSLTIALLPERNVFDQKKRYQPIQDYLSGQLGMKVSFKLLDNYQLIFSEILDNRVDGAFFGSMNGAIAQLKGGVEILARPVELSGVSTYHGLLFTKKGGPVTNDPATWKGKKIALVNRAPTAGYLYPLSRLRGAKITIPYETYFSQALFTGSHDAAILSVLNGEADLGACKNTIFEEYVKHHPESIEALVVLAESARVPSNGLGVRPALPSDLKQKIRSTLLGMHENPDGQRVLRQFQAQRFIETSMSDYQPVFEMAREAGIDLAQWSLRDLR